MGDLSTPSTSNHRLSETINGFRVIDNNTNTSESILNDEIPQCISDASTESIFENPLNQMLDRFREIEDSNKANTGTRSKGVLKALQSQNDTVSKINSPPA